MVASASVADLSPQPKPDLPDQVYHAILAHASNGTLRMCKLASRKLAPLATSLLFSEMVVDISDIKRNLQAFLAFIFASPLVATAIRRLFFTQSDDQEFMHALILTCLLRALPNLQDLLIDVVLVAPPLRPVVSTDASEQPPARSLFTLDINCRRGSKRNGLLDVLELFGEINVLQLRTLPWADISGCDIPLGLKRLPDSSVAFDLGRRNFRLSPKYLILNPDTSCIDPVAPTLILRLLQNTPTMLNLVAITMSIEDHQQAAELGEVIRIRGPFMISLELDFSTLDYYDFIEDDDSPITPMIYRPYWRALNLRSCTSLKRFVLAGRVSDISKCTCKDYAPLKLFLDIMSCTHLTNLEYLGFSIHVRGKSDMTQLLKAMFRLRLYGLEFPLLRDLLVDCHSLKEFNVALSHHFHPKGDKFMRKASEILKRELKKWDKRGVLRILEEVHDCYSICEEHWHSNPLC